MLRNSGLLRIGGRVSHENTVVAFFDLVQSPGVVVSTHSYQQAPFPGHAIRSLRSHWNVSTIDHFRPAGEWIGIERDVVSTTEAHFS